MWDVGILYYYYMRLREENLLLYNIVRVVRSAGCDGKKSWKKKKRTAQWKREKYIIMVIMIVMCVCVCVCNIKNNKCTSERARVCVYRWRRPPAPFGRAKSQLVRRLWMRAAYVNKIRTRPQGSPRAFDVLPPDSCALHGPHARCKCIYIYIIFMYIRTRCLRCV